MSDPFLNLLCLLLPLLVLLAVLGFFLRLILIAVSVASVVKRVERTLREVARNAPPEGQTPSAAWLNSASQTLSQWNQLSSIQQARSGIKQTEIMAMAAQARFPLRW